MARLRLRRAHDGDSAGGSGQGGTVGNAASKGRRSIWTKVAATGVARVLVAALVLVAAHLLAPSGPITYSRLPPLALLLASRADPPATYGSRKRVISAGVLLA